MEVWFKDESDEHRLFISDPSLSESLAHRIADSLELEGFVDDAWVEEK